MFSICLPDIDTCVLGERPQTVEPAALGPNAAFCFMNLACLATLMNGTSLGIAPVDYLSTEEEGCGMDLREFPVSDGIEARYASVEELRDMAENADDQDIKARLHTSAALREMLEARDSSIVDELIGRLDTDVLDDVTIVLEMTTQQAVEEELRTGRLCKSVPE